MKAIVTLLGSATALTTLLADGVNSIYTNEANQGVKVPHVIVDVADIEPFDSMNDAAKLDEYQVRIFSISDRPYNKGSKKGAEEIAEQVRIALDGIAGTFAGEVIGDIRFESASTFTDRYGGNKRVVYEHIYQVFKHR